MGQEYGKQYADYLAVMEAMEAQYTWDAVHGAQLAFLLENTSPEVLGRSDCVLVCDSAEQVAAFRPILDAAGLSHIGMRVANPLPTGRKWTAEMSAAKEAARRRLWRNGPAYTAPTTKARKAARRRAKAGRKASR